MRIRGMVWQGALRLIAKNPLLGTGPETFAYAFLQHRPESLNATSEWDFLYSKAHNEYLHLATGIGIPGTVLYLTLLAQIARYSYTNRNKTGVIVAGWVGCLASLFFGFSTVVVSVFLWLLPALIVTKEENV